MITETRGMITTGSIRVEPSQEALIAYYANSIAHLLDQPPWPLK
jgi:glycerol-3-phosphate O-acyltransferase